MHKKNANNATTKYGQSRYPIAHILSFLRQTPLLPISTVFGYWYQKSDMQYNNEQKFPIATCTSNAFFCIRSLYSGQTHIISIPSDTTFL